MWKEYQMNTSNSSNEQNPTSTEEEIDITPDISLMPKLGYAGYSAPQAIGELVDNSIDARIDGKLLKMSVSINKEYISVADNGSGMNKHMASKSFVLAFSKKSGQLGEFGLGMKTACLSIGDYFEVTTSALGEACRYKIHFDRKEWDSSGKGWKVPLTKEKATEEEHYTILKIEKLKVFYPNLHNFIREDLQRRYAPFIRAGQIELKVNNKFCKPEEFDLILETRKEFKIELDDFCSISGWYALLREGSQKGFYGFHTFRRGRMITTYDKIGFEQHPTLARIIGEIHMDHVPVTHNKREFIKESSEYRKVEKAVREEIKELVRSARGKATQDTVTDQLKRDVELWKDKISQTLSSDVFKNYTSKIRNVEAVPDLKGAEQEIVDSEKRDQNENPMPVEPAVPKDGEKERTPHKKQEKLKHVIRIKGKNIVFDHSFAPLGINQPWKTYIYDPAKGLEIYTNTDFPAYLVTTDKVFYAVLHISEALAEVFVQIANEDAAHIEDLKELILRKASELKAQL